MRARRRPMSAAQVEEARRQHALPAEKLVHVSLPASAMATLIGSLNFSLRTLRTDWDERAVPPAHRAVHAGAMRDLHALRFALVTVTRDRLGDRAWSVPNLSPDWHEAPPSDWVAGVPRHDA